MDALQSFLSFIQAHPWLAYASVFLVALTESLALIGLIVPGAILMFAIGTLITTGYLDFTYTAIWAVLGAISGDGLSYWLGHRYRQQLQNIWPLSRYPGAFDKGVTFFKRHGGKSVLFGRFIGPLRPIIPAIAGMFGMPLRQFMSINILSGIAWAPLYLLPGMAFGLSLELAGEVAGRLIVWIVALLVCILLVIWLARHIHSFLLHHTAAWIERILVWSHRHPVMKKITGALLLPNAPEYRGLAWLSLLFLFSVLLLTLLAELAGSFSVIQGLEHLILNLPSFIKTPLADSLFNFFHILSNATSLSMFALAILIWLLQQRQWLLAGHLLLVWLIPLIIIMTVNFFMPHSTSTLALSSSLLFFLALLFGNEMTEKRLPSFYAFMAVVVFFIFLSVLYWQQRGFINASIELLIGVSWASLMGIAYRRHILQQRTHYKIIPLCALLILCGWSLMQPHEPDIDTQPTVIVWSQQDWQDHLWQTLPDVRDDIRQTHTHPFNIQWQGNESAIAQKLHEAGWHQSDRISWRTMLNSLQSSPGVRDIFILPHIHHGRYENSRWVKYQNNKLYVIRLWKSRYVITNLDNESNLWFGNISIMQQQSQMGWHYLQTSMKFDSALDALRAEGLSFEDKKKVLLITP